jgi:hypothetical protein
MTKQHRVSRLLASMLAIVLVVASGAVPRNADAQITGFVGRVYHLVTLEPVSGAAITVGEAQSLSDEQGWYTLPLSAGRYTVAAQAAGYIGMSQPLQRVGENLTTVDFAMIPVDPDKEMNALIAEKLPLGEQTLSLELLGEAQSGEIVPSGISELPATIRVAVRADPAVAASPILEVITLDFEEYIKGVLPYEMSPAYPLEALKAQAIAARSYAAANLNKHASDGADVCSSVHCQVWKPTHYATTDLAVDATRGMAATYNGSIIYAFYHGHCDGHTRNSEDVWSTAVPYLRGVACSCGYTTLWGHGVGMCQEGARAMAGAGAPFDQIVKHYYTGVSLLSGPSAALSEARVEPATGNEGATYTYRVRHTSTAGTQPPMANVIIDGHAFAMNRDGGSAGTGWTYAYATRLSPGAHTYRFEFDDGFARLAKAPVTGMLSGPTVTPVTPAPAVETELQGNITASTSLDWAAGLMDGTTVVTIDKDVLALAAGQGQGTYTSPALVANATFVAYGLMWYAQTPDGSLIGFETRSSLDGVSWGGWHAQVGEPYVSGNDRLQSAELVFGEARYLQYRIVLHADGAGASPRVRNIRIVCIDSRPGPLVDELEPPIDGTLSQTVISRAAWGANESWMTWAPQYQNVQAMAVHHTVTSDGGLDPAAIVRAIYAFHALPEPDGRGWGDIGYNYLVDASGRIYEGRYGGPRVIGHHAGDPHNAGTVGISLIGNYEDAPVSAAMYDGLTTFLADQCVAFGVDPLGQTYLADRWLPTIFGHRDVSATACPGQYAYTLLPSIRSDTLARMSGPPPTVTLTSPVSGRHVRGVVELEYTSSGVVSSMSYYVDGVLRAQQGGVFTWRWNTALSADGPHSVSVVVTNGAGSSESSVTVTVDNTPPTGVASAPAWTSLSQIPVTISGEADGVAMSQGWSWEGESLYHQTGVLAADAAASGGYAWLGRGGTDAGGAWYGPYTCALPTGAYQVVYRLRADDITSSTGLATLDVADAAGGITYALQAVAANELPGTGYQDIALPLDYASVAPSCQVGGAGLEFRTWYSGAGNLWLDRVRVFTAPVSREGVHLWPAPASDGPVRLTIRLLDLAGNATERDLATGVDRTAPIWSHAYGSGYWGRDITAGLEVTGAAWQQSLDGGSNWTEWQPLSLHAASGEQGFVLFYSEVPQTGLVRYRAVDRAGNSSVSPPVDAGLEPPPLNEKVYLPLVLH